MTHRQWNATVKRGLALMDKNPQQAVRLFERLGQVVDHHNRRSVQDWHGLQTRFLLSLAQDRAGDAASAGQTLVRIVNEHRQELSYHTRGFTSASAAAALAFAEAGRTVRAMRVLDRVTTVVRKLQPRDKLLKHARTAVRRAREKRG
jgi:hypothetical protein